MCVIKHSNNLQHRVVSPQGVPRARGVLDEDTLATAYRPYRGRDVLNRTLRRSSRGLGFATRQYRNCSNQADAMRHDELSCALLAVQKRTARARGTAYAPLMGSPQISAASCPHCRGTTLRATRPSRSGCFRICSGCNHMWHVTAEALRAEKAPVRSRATEARHARVARREHMKHGDPPD